MRNAAAIRSFLFLFVLLAFSHASFGQIAITVSFGPPALPVYEQPICPEDGYIWTPGFWAYDDDDGYYWVPGTWVEAPQPGYLWTPGYWGWSDEGVFIFHEGYWGEHVGFYGGINYGYGYGGRGYEGGRWDNGHFFYNTYVNRVNVTVIHNTYNTTIVENNTTRVSYNGGSGGVEARPTAQEETYSKEPHVGRVAAQNEHIQQARSNPALRASNNQGKPPIAATAKPGDFKSGVVSAREAGGAYKAPPANAARGNETRTGNEARPATAAPPSHASELQPHQSTPPNTGNAATDKRYQQQQDKLAAKQNQEHQKLQQQQEKEHQQAAKKNASDPQKQQMEQRHTQQTQQLEQKHATQQQELQQRQQPRPSEKPH